MQRNYFFIAQKCQIKAPTLRGNKVSYTSITVLTGSGIIFGTQKCIILSGKEGRGE